MVIVPADIPHTMVLDAYASGSFTLDIEKLSGDTITSSTSFQAIPASTSTEATFLWDPAVGIAPAATLVVDFNGDHINDVILTPTVNGTIIYDVTPPEARISFSTSTQQLIIEGIDEQGTTSVRTTATSSTITDQAGNTTQLLFSKYKVKPRKIELVINKIIQNGAVVSTSTIPLTYKWNILGTGVSTTIKTLASFVKTSSTSVETHYRPKKDETIIMTIPIDLDDNDSDDDCDLRPTREKLEGAHIIKLRIADGKVSVGY